MKKNRIKKKVLGRIVYIFKRDGRKVKFDQSKITNAIHKAFRAISEENGEMSKKISDNVVVSLNEKFVENMPTVEQIQDVVEEELMKAGQEKVAKAYIIYRQKRKEIREAKYYLLSQDVKTKITPNALRVLESRYLKKDENGKIIETPQQLFQRVATNIASAEKNYKQNISDDELFQTEEEFYRILANLEFLPNSPTLMNAGGILQQLSACFVIPVNDSMESIFTAVKHTALIHQTGGGTGFSFSRLRPKNDHVKSTDGVASGPISFMRVFNMATEVVKQGGKRRGANMGILRVDHPDILEFISCKDKEGFLDNFNISVALTDSFMQAVESGKSYPLINPRTGQVIRRLDARNVFDMIVRHAWVSGDPGIVFIDRMNDERTNPTPYLGSIESTNPCAEQPLLPYESCNLGSINLDKMLVKKGRKMEVDWEKLKRVVRTAVRFLDNVIDMNHYPLPEIEMMTRGNRRIGLGVMGFADMLIHMGIPYDSRKALNIAEKVMKFINDESHKRSRQLARERGVFPNYKDSVFYKKGGPKVRNVTTTTIAPTGTIGIIAGCSQGIEPLFALAYIRHSYLGKDSERPEELIEINPLFEEIAKKEGFYSKKLMKKVVEKGSIRDIKKIPLKWRKVFITAHDINPEWHVKMQAAFQKYTDNAVSKTINFPNSASVADIKKAYLLSYKQGCKGITVYRSGSKQMQILNVGVPKKDSRRSESKRIKAQSEKTEKSEVSPELLNPSPDLPDIPPGSCPTCTV